jgi:hypothetical protein
MEEEGKGERPGRAATATATGGDGPLDGLILFGRRAPDGVYSVCIEAELTLTLPFIKRCKVLFGNIALTDADFHGMRNFTYIHYLIEIVYY